MELYERLDLAKIAYLAKMSFGDFKIHCSASCKNEASRRIKYDMLKAFCLANIKAKGEIRRIYSYTTPTPNEVGGRLYCGNSIQGLSKNIRGFLCKNMTDLDMKSAHPTIARWLCSIHKIDCPNLCYFIENRTDIYSRFAEGVGKNLFLKALNDDKINKKVDDAFFIDFDKECKNIQAKLTALAEYKHIVDTVPLDRTHNWNGSAINRIMCVFENKILQEVITVLNARRIEIGVLMFDGCMIYGNHYNNTELLADIERAVNDKFVDLKMTFTTKEHDNTILIPDNPPVYDAEISSDDCYDAIKREFEEIHAKIVNKALFIKELDDGNVNLSSRDKFRTAYEDKKYTDYSVNPHESKQFILRWFLDENKRKYEDVGVFPPPIICPANIYNLWKPFAISKHVGDYERDEAGLQKFIRHIEILCNHDKTVADYVIKWFAQMFQYPAVKTVILTFISDEGAGKGTLLDVISEMMGKTKILTSTHPSRDVWGQFNGMMCNSFFVNLNEMCKKEAMDAEGRIKGLVTDSSLMINKKGLDSYEIISYHRFIITTNKEDPVNTKKNDRRNIIIRSSDELMNNIDYFADLRKSVLNTNTLRTIYDYLMEIPDMDTFGSIIRPVTEYQEDIQEASRSFYDRWIEDFTRDNQDNEEKIIKLYGNQQCALFSAWCKKHNIQYDTSSIKMALAIKRLGIDGIRCGVKLEKGNVTEYNITILKKHYLIGLLL